ncbi:30S ribosomal protein S20 [Desulfurivibrio dismutans]|uniref:30S ribosomal protein S20 n=1 Tax=Desulfurivibrio dismutans TaxID=1398908 RepID=UPI0023DC5E77|nr:30S ribosomal protein S20 [Desulfurivibrio alkaliphilus]MDF1614622.1 30S ribosomal protein S20 [Desulfurivibrio alkaliphilus]
MANHKSAIKRNRQNVVRRERNRSNRSRLKTLYRRIDEAMVANSPDQAREALQNAVPMIAKAVNKGVLHRNTAARKISRLTRRVNAFAQNA